MTLSAMVARPTGRNWVRADRFGGRCKAFLCRGGTHQGNDPEAGALHGSALRQQGQVSGKDFRSQSTNIPARRGPNTHRSQNWCRARELRRPSRNRLASFLKLGYLMRPIGGVLVGHIGDKFGRRTVESSNRSALRLPGRSGTKIVLDFTPMTWPRFRTGAFLRQFPDVDRTAKPAGRPRAGGSIRRPCRVDPRPQCELCFGGFLAATSDARRNQQRFFPTTLSNGFPLRNFPWPLGRAYS